MLIVLRNIENSHVLFFDAEYSEGFLIQFSGILLKKIEENIFQISKSLNTYVKMPETVKVNNFIKNFTGITDSYLETFGLSLEESKTIVEELINIDEKDLLVVSHGLTNDRRVLLDNEINLYEDCNGNEIRGICTYNMAKRILKREKRLKLEDIANESGLFITNDHNAFTDAWATIAIFSFLCKKEEEGLNEKLLQSKRD